MNINETNETRVSVEAKIPYVAYTDINRKEFEDNTTLHGSFEVKRTSNTLELSESNIAGQKKVVIINSATKDTAGIMSSFDKQNLDNSTVIQVQWNYNSHINSFVTAGIYNIVGERTNDQDGLPISNASSGHSINARLEVLDSSIPDSSKDTDKCITQKLTLSNRVAGDGDVYIRTGRGRSKETITWETWGKLQQNIEVGLVTTLNDLIDNGIYSGVYKYGSGIYDFETFVLVVINDYAIAGDNKKISQFKYAVTLDGTVSYKSRLYSLKFGEEKARWDNWLDINEGNINKAIKNAIAEIVDNAPEAFDTLREIADWIANDETGAVALANAISANAAAINAERTRAIGQEGLLNNAIAGEKSRAEQAEQTINKKLDDEIERSAATDLGLLRNIDNEARRATDAEQGIKDKAIEADSLNFLTRANVVALDYKTIEGVGDEIIIPAATAESAGVMSAADKVKLNNSYKDINVSPNEIDVELDIEDNAENTHHVIIPAATTTTAGVMSAEDKVKLDNFAVEGTEIDLNTYDLGGVYFFNSKRLTNVPIINDSIVSARLTVLTAYNNSSHVITQVLNLNNLGGGEGNIYIRSCQNGNWKAWGKLQTNVEVGQVNQEQLDDLVDNGIYSGVLSTTGETFVIICINNYAIAQQVGVHHISHLKYSLVVGTGEVKIEKRTRDAYGFWTEWSEIGGGSNYELPVATVDTIGGVRLGTTADSKFIPLVNIDQGVAGVEGSGVGIRLDSRYFINKSSELTFKHNGTMMWDSSGIGVALGTTHTVADGSSGLLIPCVIGTGQSVDGSKWNSPSVGILYNKEQFCLKYNGLNLKDGIGSGVTKVTWDSLSNMNDFKTPGVYDIYGERTVDTDNLPISNTGGGHSISARLTVVASTLQPANNEICITQFLQLSNRVGGDGATYVRTYNENNNGMNGWSAWQKQMGMVETLINNNDATVGTDAFTGDLVSYIGKGLNGMIENGMYSGIYTDALDSYSGMYKFNPNKLTFFETFVLVVVNDYAASGKLNLPRHITQLKYAVDAITGQSTVKKRVGTGNSAISWSGWEDIGGGGSQEVDITDAVKADALQTLVTKGSVKEGVTYKIYCLKQDFNNITLDNQDKLTAKILEDTVNSPSWVKVLFSLHAIHDEMNDDALLITGKYFTDLRSVDFVISKNFNYVEVSNMTQL